MGSRDHSYECEVCGLYRGGMNDLRCDCDGEDFLDEISRERRLSNLAANLRVAAGLEFAYRLGWWDPKGDIWRSNTVGQPAPGWGGGE